MGFGTTRSLLIAQLRFYYRDAQHLNSGAGKSIAFGLPLWSAMLAHDGGAGKATNISDKPSTGSNCCKARPRALEAMHP